MNTPKSTAAGACGLAVALLLGGCSIPFDSPFGGGSSSAPRPAPVASPAPVPAPASDQAPAQAESQPGVAAEGSSTRVTRFEGDWQDEEGQPVARSDAQSCYDSANALVNRDSRIDEDLRAADSGVVWAGGAPLMQSMRSYGNETRRVELYADCLRSRGYQRR